MSALHPSPRLVPKFHLGTHLSGQLPYLTYRHKNLTYPGSTGLSTVYSYFDNTGDQRLETIQNKHGSTQRSKFDYTYNTVGTIASWTQQADSSTAVVNTLAYDNADQLTTLSGTSAGSTTVTGTTSLGASSVIVNGVAATLTGSTSFSATVPTLSGTNIFAITARTIAGAPVTQLFQATVSGSVTATALAYDLNGNTTTDENGNTYTWDALNRLTRITYPSTAYTTMAYDGLSRRTQIAEYDSSHALTSTKNYLWIGSEIAEERDASNVVTKRFFPQGEQQSGTNYYYTFDHLGSTREMLNSSGTIVARYGYDPYGKVTLVSGSNLATKQYAGYYVHQTSGLYLTKFRALDPSTGRWLNRDPISERGGMNLYGYVRNDPEALTDPLGLKGPSPTPGPTTPTIPPPPGPEPPPPPPWWWRVLTSVSTRVAAIIVIPLMIPGDTPVHDPVPANPVPAAPEPSPQTQSAQPVLFPQKLTFCGPDESPDHFHQPEGQQEDLIDCVRRADLEGFGWGSAAHTQYVNDCMRGKGWKGFDFDNPDTY